MVIAVGYMLRYNPAIEAAKALLEEVRSFVWLIIACHIQICCGELHIW